MRRSRPPPPGGRLLSSEFIGPEFVSRRYMVLEGKFSPTVSYLHVDSDDNEQTENLVGVGCMLSLVLTYTVSENFLFTVSYGHLLQLPLSINEYKPLDRTSEKWIQAGVLSLTLNFRFGMNQKL